MPKTISDTIGLPEAGKSSKANKIPTLTLEGDGVLRYNNAVDQKKNAEAVMAELRPELLEPGLLFLFEQNAGKTGKDRIKSVKLVYRGMTGEEAGEDGPEQVCMLSLSDKAGTVDRIVIDAAFRSLKTAQGKPADPNSYVGYGVKAAFDTGCFYDKDGKWDQRRYDKVEAALVKVAAELKLDENPLSCSKVLQVKPSFFEDRLAHFTPKQNVALQMNGVVPCTVSLEPVRTL